MAMVTLQIARHSSVLFQTSDILELSLDPVNTSGLEYFAQEARSASLKLIYTPELVDIFEGSLRQLKCGFHCLTASVYDGDDCLIHGVVAADALNVSYISPTARTVEINVLDFLGLILTLADDRKHILPEGTVDPVKTACAVITGILAPIHAEPEDAPYANADVRALVASLGAINWQHAWLYYDYNKWLPFNHYRIEILNAEPLLMGDEDYTLDVIRFGYLLEDGGAFLVFMQHLQVPQHGDVFGGELYEWYRLRKWRLDGSRVTLVMEIDLQKTPGQPPLQIPPYPDLTTNLFSVGDYWIEGYRAKYSGPGALVDVPVVGGEYSSRELLGELLRVSNAVLCVNDYSFQIRNRPNPAQTGLDMPLLRISDPLQASLADHGLALPEITPLAIASTYAIASVNRHYKSLFSRLRWALRISLHTSMPELTGISPYEILWRVIVFDAYAAFPFSVAYDPNTGSVEIEALVDDTRVTPAQ